MKLPRTFKNDSLLLSVFWRMGLTMLVAIAAIVALLLYEFDSRIDSMRDRSLNGQVGDIIRHISVTGDDGVDLALPDTLRAAYETKENPPRYVILDHDGGLVTASPQLAGPLTQEVMPEPGAVVYFESLDPISGRAMYGIATRPTEFDGRIVVQAAQSAQHHDVVADSLLDEAFSEYFWVVVLVFGAILLITFVSLRNALAPLCDASSEAARIGPGNLTHRLNATRLPREIRPLIDAINSALDRVEEGFKTQQRFTADAAHEMRTPIAILHGHIDTLGIDENQALRQNLVNLERVVSQLLKLAQVDAHSVPDGSRADLASVAREVISFLAPHVITTGKTIALEGPEQLVINGDADALEVALRNLVENALSHTPVGGEVVVEIGAVPPSFWVLDRGPGIPVADRPFLFDRFWRKNRNRDSGVGLGLAIVARIAASHSADLSVTDRPGGGSVFSMSFSGNA